MFHTIVGHYLGCGWDAERIFDARGGNFRTALAQYIAEGRLAAEIARSARQISGHRAAAVRRRRLDEWLGGRSSRSRLRRRNPSSRSRNRE